MTVLRSVWTEVQRYNGSNEEVEFIGRVARAQQCRPSAGAVRREASQVGGSRDRPLARAAKHQGERLRRQVGVSTGNTPMSTACRPFRIEVAPFAFRRHCAPASVPEMARRRGRRCRCRDLSGRPARALADIAGQTAAARHARSVCLGVMVPCEVEAVFLASAVRWTCRDNPARSHRRSNGRRWRLGFSASPRSATSTSSPTS